VLFVKENASINAQVNSGVKHNKIFNGHSRIDAGDLISIDRKRENGI